MWLPGSSMRAPGATAGPHETALHPIVCALDIFFASHVEPSALPVKMEMEPSLQEKEYDLIKPIALCMWGTGNARV